MIVHPIIILAIVFIASGILAGILAIIFDRWWSKKELVKMSRVALTQITFGEIVASILTVIVTASTMSIMLMAAIRFMNTGDPTTITFLEKMVGLLSPFLVLVLARFGFGNRQ